MVSIQRIKKSIHAYTPAPHESGDLLRQAAVAVILRQQAAATEALFILRASRDNDPWSGQIAFPGGHYEVDDASLRHTAERETQEEVGLELSRDGEYIGQLDPVQTTLRRQTRGVVVTPFVYELKTPAALSANYEVAEMLWGSLNEMQAGTRHTRIAFTLDGRAHDYPGYALGDNIIWGLTYRLLEQIFTQLDPSRMPQK